MSEAFDTAALVAAPAGEARIWPTSVQELGEAERLVLWAFRRWVADRGELPMLAREFDRQLRRSEARPALLSFDAAFTALTRHARRTIVHHQPCCPCLGADEVCVIAIVAALQGGAPQAARCMAQWLVRAPGLEAFVAPLDDFAACLTGSGFDLPYRTRPRAVAAPGPHRPTLASIH